MGISPAMGTDFQEERDAIIPRASPHGLYENAKFCLEQGGNLGKFHGIRYLELAASMDHPEACCDLGLVYLFGLNGQGDTLKAHDLLLKAAQKDVVEAQCYLSKLYFEGVQENSKVLIKKDLKKAFKWTQKASSRGDSLSQFNLGFMYEKGMGVKISHGRACYWYGLAARKELPEAITNLANLYQRGGDKRKPKLAIQLYKKADKKGFVPATYNLGVMYQKGRGTKKNDRTAYNYFLKAANQGLPQAQFMCGTLTYGGVGVKKNPQVALEWFQKVSVKVQEHEIDPH